MISIFHDSYQKRTKISILHRQIETDKSMKISFILSFILLAINLPAQKTWGPDKSFKEVSDFYLELIGGASVSTYKTSNSDFNALESDYLVKPTYGLGARYHLNNLLSIGANATYRSHGMMLVSDLQPGFQANYINISVPFTFDCCVKKIKQLAPNVFFFAAPYAGYFLNGEVSTSTDKVALTANDVSTWDYGAEAGIGVRIPTFSMDGKSYLNISASFIQGFANTLPDDASINTTDPTVSQFIPEGSYRWNQGLRLTISYELSLEKRKMTTFTAGGDGKRTYKRYINVR